MSSALIKCLIIIIIIIIIIIKFNLDPAAVELSYPF
jgi:hypothetical protein